MQQSVLTRQSGHFVHPDKVCLTVSSCTHIRSRGLRACGLWIITGACGIGVTMHDMWSDPFEMRLRGLPCCSGCL